MPQRKPPFKIDERKRFYPDDENRPVQVDEWRPEPPAPEKEERGLALLALILAAISGFIWLKGRISTKGGGEITRQDDPILFGITVGTYLVAGLVLVAALAWTRWRRLGREKRGREKRGRERRGRQRRLAEKDSARKSPER